MKNAQFQSILKRVLERSQIPAVVIRSELVLVPIGRLRRFVSLEGSAYSKTDFRNWCGSQPLFVPLAFKTLSHSINLGKAAGWCNYADESAVAKLVADLANQGIEHIRNHSIASISRALDSLIAMWPDRIMVLEELLYCNIYMANEQNVEAFARQFLGLSGGRQHQIEAQHRGKEILSIYEKSPDAAVEALDNWCRETAVRLGYEKFIVPEFSRSLDVYSS